MQERAAAASITALIRVGQDRLKGRAATIPPNLRLNISFAPLSTAAWESAVATQALVHMPYDETHALTRVYAGTRVFDEYEGEAARHWIELSAVPADPASMSRDELKSALRELALNQGYQRTLVASGEHLLRTYDDALAALN